MLVVPCIDITRHKLDSGLGAVSGMDVCYLSSDYLDAHVRADRTAFDISERVAGTPLVDDISLDDIRASVGLA